MTAVNLAVVERDNLRRKADELDRKSNRLATEGDEKYEQSANAAAQAFQIREEVKKYQTLIDGLGGEPKEKRKPVVKLLPKKAKATA